MNDSIYSYDIFDTCLVRACGSPEMIWDILANRILGNTSNTADVNDFILIRRQAEGKARELLINETKEDVTIGDIYNFCDFSSLTSISNQEIMKSEMEVEEDMLVPVFSILQEIDKLHQAGENITFISDMYLSKNFIKKILINTGFFHDGDRLYISGEIGKSKSTGHLYDYVKKELNISFKQWIHKGDNKYSDYQIPKRKGIKTILINHSLSYYERKAIEFDLALAPSDLKKITHISRAVRLSMTDEPAYRFATDFIAPQMTTFVHNILEDARHRGIHHLYFMARDAYILYIIAEEFARLYPGISLHYLYASRQSLYKPDENCMSYLQQEGLTRSHSAIVDMVGSRRCQHCINKLFTQHGFDKIHAYYYEVTPYRLMSNDTYTAMYYQEKLAGSPYYHHASHPLLEQYFGITDQLRTIGYKKEFEKILPIYEPDLVDAQYKKKLFNINKKICVAFAKHYINAYIAEPFRSNNFFFAVFADFCHVPHRDYLSALCGFFSTDSANQQEPLLEKRNLFSIIFDKKHYLRWKNGNLVFNSGRLYRPIITTLRWYYIIKKRCPNRKHSTNCR